MRRSALAQGTLEKPLVGLTALLKKVAHAHINTLPKLNDAMGGHELEQWLSL